MRLNPAQIFLGAFLINNVLLFRFLGLCPFFGVSTSVSTATGMSNLKFLLSGLLLKPWDVSNFQKSSRRRALYMKFT